MNRRIPSNRNTCNFYLEHSQLTLVNMERSIVPDHDYFSIPLDRLGAFDFQLRNVSTEERNSVPRETNVFSLYLFIIGIHKFCDDIRTDLRGGGLTDIIDQFFDDIDLNERKDFASLVAVLLPTVSSRIRLSSCPSFV